MITSSIFYFLGKSHDRDHGKILVLSIIDKAFLYQVLNAGGLIID